LQTILAFDVLRVILSALLIKTFYTSPCILTYLVLMGNIPGYVLIHIWHLLDTSCNIFLLKLHT